jgi:hypothetical protein
MKTSAPSKEYKLEQSPQEFLHLPVRNSPPVESSGSGANPTIASYNASVVKIYSAVTSMARF